MLKAFKYQIFPNKAQKVLLEKHFGCARFIFNWALAEKKNRFDEFGINVSRYDLQSYLPELKELSETIWLNDVSAQSLQSTLLNLDRAYQNFFKKISKFPKFKSKHSFRDSFANPQGNKLDFGIQKIQLPKFPEGIKGNFNRKFEGKIKTVTISKRPSQKFYASVLVETSDADIIPPNPEIGKSLGLDFGIKDLIVTSEGLKIPNPKFLRGKLAKLRRHQRTLSRKTKDSKNRIRAKLSVALVHEKISNARSNYLHQITSGLTRENQAVNTLCIEDLSVKNMLENKLTNRKSFNRSIFDVSFRELRRQLEYKCNWYGKNLLTINRYEASSKTCHKCSRVNDLLSLADRTWNCKCGASHDRDLNAAINIRNFAFKSLSLNNNKFSELQISESKIPEGTREILDQTKSNKLSFNQVQTPVRSTTGLK